MWLPLLLILGNYWIWKILHQNIFLGILLIVTSFLAYKNTEISRSKQVYIICLLLLAIFQYKTTQITSLVALSDTQISIQQKRINEYPPVHISFRDKNLWIPAAHWFEEKNISIASYHMTKNLSEAIDPNLYFFANHPRERVGITEFEKLPYFLIIFFFYGLLTLISKASRSWYIFSLVIPIALLTYIGHENPLGPFILFPWIISTTIFGIKRLIEKFSNYRK
jgi:hypothetical protein